jgi:hypothetical protein
LPGTGRRQPYRGIAAAAVFQQTAQCLVDVSGRFVDADTFLRVGVEKGEVGA